MGLRAPSLITVLAVGGLGTALLGPPEAWAQEGPVLYPVDTDRSSLYVVTGRGGLLSFLGHDHVLVPLRWSGELCWAEEAPEDGSARIEMDTRTIVIDREEDRRATGLGAGPTARQLGGIQEKVQGPTGLDTQRHPTAILEVGEVTGSEGTALEVAGELELRGVRRMVRFPAELGSDDEAGLRIQGRFGIRHTDYDMEPESVAGVVRVTDEVEVRFDLRTGPPKGTCPPAGT